MSVEELKFNIETTDENLTFKFEDGKLRQYQNDIKLYTYDRSEAHLLMLYLQEHLKVIIPPIANPKEVWQCNCGRMHPKDYVCTRL